jgi:hypothetical protein
MSIDGILTVMVLHVDDISISERRNFHSVDIAVGNGEDRFSINATDFHVDAAVKMIGSDFAEISRKQIALTRFDREKIILSLQPTRQEQEHYEKNFI